MYQPFPTESDRQRVLTPVNGLRENLSQSANAMAVKEDLIIYLTQELQISSAAADQLYATFQEPGFAIDSDLYALSPEYAIEQFRLAFYREIIPLYGDTHSVNEYDMWLPKALEVVVPPNGRHDADTCLRINGIMDGYCEMGECPVVTIVDDVTGYFTSLAALNHSERAQADEVGVIDIVECEHQRSLLGEAVRREYVPELTKNALLKAAGVAIQRSGGAARTA